MPQHKVSAAVKAEAALKDEVKKETVISNGTSIIDAAIDGDKQETIILIAGQLKEFQESQNDKVIKGTKIGTALGKGLLEHV